MTTPKQVALALYRAKSTDICTHACVCILRPNARKLMATTNMHLLCVFISCMYNSRALQPFLSQIETTKRHTSTYMATYVIYPLPIALTRL